MSKSKELRAKAEEWDQHAAAACDPDSKIRFQKLAHRWRELEIREVMTER
jgi:hypothetical protein